MVQSDCKGCSDSHLLVLLLPMLTSATFSVTGQLKHNVLSGRSQLESTRWGFSNLTPVQHIEVPTQGKAPTIGHEFQNTGIDSGITYENRFENGNQCDLWYQKNNAI